MPFESKSPCRLVAMAALAVLLLVVSSPGSAQDRDEVPPVRKNLNFTYSGNQLIKVTPEMLMVSTGLKNREFVVLLGRNVKVTNEEGAELSVTDLQKGQNVIIESKPGSLVITIMKEVSDAG